MLSVQSAHTGGRGAHPTYEQVSAGGGNFMSRRNITRIITRRTRSAIASTAAIAAATRGWRKCGASRTDL
ncbi:MAG: hypothetical protein ABIO19_10285, partial [Burkholderiaceae bacterium]